MNEIFALENQGDIIRLYGRLKGTIKGRVADYSVYVDNKSLEWLHIHLRKEDRYYLFPFNSRLPNYLEYLKWLG